MRLTLTLSLLVLSAGCQNAVKEKCQAIFVTVADRGVNEREFMRHCQPLMEPVVSQCSGASPPARCQAIISEVNQELLLKTYCMTQSIGCPEYGVRGRWP